MLPVLWNAAPLLPVLLPAQILWQWVRWGCSMLTPTVNRPKKVLVAILVTATGWHSPPRQDRPSNTVCLHPITIPRLKDARGITTHQHSTPCCYCKIVKKGHLVPVLETPGTSAMARGIGEQPPSILRPHGLAQCIHSKHAWSNLSRGSAALRDCSRVPAQL